MGWFSTRASRAVGLSFVVVAVGCGGSKPPVKTPSPAEGDTGKTGPAEVGKPAPELSVDTVNGKGKVSISSLAGKIAVVDFWATWCGPCKQSFPKLEDLAKKYSGKVEIVGVSVDDSKDGVADFAKSNGATFAIGWDDGHAIANRWKVGTMPTTYILDATGTVRYIHDGYRDGEADEIGKELVALQSEAPGMKGKTEAAAAPGKDGKDGKDAAGTGATAAASSAPAADPPPAEEPADPAAKPKKGGKGGKKPPAKKPGAKPKKKPAPGTPATPQ